MNDSDSGAGTEDAGLEEPRQAETHQDVEHVAPDGVTDGHVPVTLLDDGDARETVRHTHSGCYEGQTWSSQSSNRRPLRVLILTHDGLGDAEGEPNYGDHPNHHIAEHEDSKFKKSRQPGLKRSGRYKYK